MKMWNSCESYIRRGEEGRCEQLINSSLFFFSFFSMLEIKGKRDTLVVYTATRGHRAGFVLIDNEGGGRRA